MEAAPVGEICDLINGAAFKPSDWHDEGAPIIRIQNLNDPKKPFNRTNRTLPEKLWIRAGDYLFSWSGTPGTSFGCYKWNGPEGWLNQHIFKVILPTYIIGTFFRYQMNARLSELIAKAHGGVGLQHVTKGMINEMIFVLPTLEQQQIFVDRVQQLDHLIATAERALLATEAKFSSLQHRAFRGKL